MIYPIRLLIVDWNGFALDDLSVAHGSYRAIFQAHGVEPPPLEEYRAGIRTDYLSWYHRHGIPPDVGPDQINAIRREYYLANYQKAKIREGLRELLRRCQEMDIPRVIVSGEIEELIVARLAEEGLVESFDLIRAHVRDRKAEEIRQAATYFGVDPHSAIYGDDFFEGIQAARQAGVQSAALIHPTAYSSDGVLREADPDHCISSLFHLIDILEESQRSTTAPTV